MEVIAFNGSPRKTWNTATLLKYALEGATSWGAETKLVHLYDLDFKGCRSCFGCKTKGGPSYGRCAIQDDLSPLFKEIETADALILGTPIYIGTVSGEMKSFMERLIPPRAFFQGKSILVSFIQWVRRAGRLFAMADMCSHFGGPLSEGTLVCNCIVCPYPAFRCSRRISAKTRFF
jgi:multimeric flavodoxin WrbA